MEASGICKAVFTLKAARSLKNHALFGAKLYAKTWSTSTKDSIQRTRQYSGVKSAVWNDTFIFDFIDRAQENIYVEIVSSATMGEHIVGRVKLRCDDITHEKMTKWVKIFDGDGKESGEFEFEVKILSTAPSTSNNVFTQHPTVQDSARRASASVQLAPSMTTPPAYMTHSPSHGAFNVHGTPTVLAPGHIALPTPVGGASSSASTTASKADAWFDSFDKSHDGRLSVDECARGISASFPSIDSTSASSILSALWPLFDTDGSGFLTKDEFAKRDGLFDTLMDQLQRPTSTQHPPQNSSFLHSSRVHVPVAASPAPSVLSPGNIALPAFGGGTPPPKAGAWFDSFDKNHDGQLSMVECSRGICSSYPSVDFASASSILSALWPLFDTDGSGFLTKDEFVKQGGLYDTLMDQLPQQPHSTSSEIDSAVAVAPPHFSAEAHPFPPSPFVLPAGHIALPSSSASTTASKADAWFDSFDKSHDGRLSVDECARGISASFPSIDSTSASSILSALWPLFDTDGSGFLTKDEFAKRGGLYDTLMDELQQQPKLTPSIAPPVPPRGHVVLPPTTGSYYIHAPPPLPHSTPVYSSAAVGQPVVLPAGYVAPPAGGRVVVATVVQEDHHRGRHHHSERGRHHHHG